VAEAEEVVAVGRVAVVEPVDLEQGQGQELVHQPVARAAALAVVPAAE
jgi:hypothetical protein